MVGSYLTLLKVTVDPVSLKLLLHKCHHTVFSLSKDRRHLSPVSQEDTVFYESLDYFQQAALQECWEISGFLAEQEAWVS